MYGLKILLSVSGLKLSTEVLIIRKSMQLISYVIRKQTTVKPSGNDPMTYPYLTLYTADAPQQTHWMKLDPRKKKRGGGI